MTNNFLVPLNANDESSKKLEGELMSCHALPPPVQNNKMCIVSRMAKIGDIQIIAQEYGHGLFPYKKDDTEQKCFRIGAIFARPTANDLLRDIGVQTMQIPKCLRLFPKQQADGMLMIDINSLESAIGVEGRGLEKWIINDSIPLERYTENEAEIYR